MLIQSLDNKTQKGIAESIQHLFKTSTAAVDYKNLAKLLGAPMEEYGAVAYIL